MRAYPQHTHTHTHRFIKLTAFYLKSSSLSCRAISTDIPDPLSPPLPIVHCFRQVLRTTSRIGTELLYVGSSWSSCLCTSMWRGPQEYIIYELVPTSPAVSGVSGSSILIVFVMDCRRLYGCSFVGYCLQDLFKKFKQRINISFKQYT